MSWRKRSAPAVAAVAGRGKTTSACHSTPPRAPHKWLRVLRVLADGASLTRFDAERLGDHCLPTTIARIQREGLRVEREIVEVQGRFESVARVARYWLCDAERIRARALLEGTARAPKP